MPMSIRFFWFLGKGRRKNKLSMSSFGGSGGQSSQPHIHRPQPVYATSNAQGHAVKREVQSMKHPAGSGSESGSEGSETDGSEGSGSVSEDEQTQKSLAQQKNGNTPRESEEQQYRTLFREVSHLSKAYGHSNIDEAALHTLTALAASNTKMLGNELIRQTHPRCLAGFKNGGPVLLENTLVDDQPARSNAIAWISAAQKGEAKEDFPPRYKPGTE
eukprot:gb/GECG01004095.1/.p1 GENE.gb/GECG01004095.1/~~gb/GECG01004095.1/.p1  ORF type:complete len:216 (+),score=29.39 gb/GECG01004095.1/:1-648(+)